MARKYVKKSNGEVTGRPLKEFDKKTFESLCSILCTHEELENVLQADRETIAGWCERTYGERFSATYKRFSSGGKASLRRNQFRLSSTNAAMCIWLGKQYLGQRDIPHQEEELGEKAIQLLDALTKLSCKTSPKEETDDKAERAGRDTTTGDASEGPCVVL